MRKLGLIIISITILSVVTAANAQTCRRAKDISGGEEHSMILMEDGTLWACGDNLEGQLGLGYKGAPYPKEIRQVYCGEMATDSGFLENIVAIDGGQYHSLAADQDGICWAWGSDDNGKLGNGPGSSSYVPVKVLIGIGSDPNLIKIVQVSAGRTGYHSLALTDDGRVWAWGGNVSGQCGIGNYQVSVHTPVLVSGPEAGEVLGLDTPKILAVEAGRVHSLALDEDGNVWRWGNDISNRPVKIEELESYTITSISAANGSMALDSNRNVWTWADEEGPPAVADTPERVGDGQGGYLDNITAASIGRNHCIALDPNTNVWQWKSDTDPALVPKGEMVTAGDYLVNIVKINKGYNHSLVIDSLGDVYGWGSNNGELGNGETGSSVDPVLMLCAPGDPNAIDFEKTVDYRSTYYNEDCARPYVEFTDNTLTFDICYDSNDLENPLDDVVIIDFLPDEVDYDEDLNDPNWIYNSTLHTVTWDVGSIGSWGDTVCKSIIVKVNEKAKPGGQFTNSAQLKSDRFSVTVDETVDVCCWSSEPITYVDANSLGNNNGTSWTDAFTDLNDALKCGGEIWVADGTYLADPEATGNKFRLTDAVKLYGGFQGGETSLNLRDPDEYPAILQGSFDQGIYAPVVECANFVDNVVLDGFTVTGGNVGIRCYNTSDPCDLERIPLIENCTIEYNNAEGIRADYLADAFIIDSVIQNNRIGIQSLDSRQVLLDCMIISNSEDGLYCDDSDMTVIDSTIKSNGYNGLYIYLSDLEINNSTIEDNGYNGLYIYLSVLDIESCTIDNNDESGIYSPYYSTVFIDKNLISYNDDYGIYCSNNSSYSEITNNIIYENSTGIHFNDDIDVMNNTVAFNSTSGIDHTDDSTTIKNCIIWDNGTEITGCAAQYCCVKGGYSGTGNIDDDPLFINSSDPNYNLHIEANSPCIGAADQSLDYSGQTDFDYEPRNADGAADIGADEYCDSAQNDADFNNDEIVDYIDFAKFSTAWLQGPSDPNWSDDLYDLNEDNTIIDTDDLVILAQNWLWMSCRKMYEFPEEVQMAMAGMEMMSMTSVSFESLTQTQPEPTIEEQITQAEGNIEFLENIKETLGEDDWEGMTESIEELIEDLQENQ